MRTSIAVVGASGFVGASLAEHLAKNPNYEVLGLARSFDHSTLPSYQIKRCDLYSLTEIEQCLAGQKVVIYVARATYPSSQLAQGYRRDYELILAKNCVRAAQKNSVQRMIYVARNVPIEQHEHSSSLEVEHCFRSSDIPTTSLKVDLIVGEQDPKIALLVRLIRLLPFIPCRPEMKEKCFPVLMGDLADLVNSCIEDRRWLDRTWVLKGSHAWTTEQILKTLASHLDKKRVFVNVPVLPRWLSQFWINRATQMPPWRDLEYTGPHQIYPMPGLSQATLTRLLEQTLSLSHSRSRNVGIVKTKTVQSVQRLPLPPGKSAHWVSRRYFTWISRFFRSWLVVIHANPRVSIGLKGFGTPLLILERDFSRTEADRIALKIVGGALVAASPEARLELIKTHPEQNNILAALDHFKPKLPWWLYRRTQALVHLWVMREFGRYLSNRALDRRKFPQS